MAFIYCSTLKFHADLSSTNSPKNSAWRLAHVVRNFLFPAFSNWLYRNRDKSQLSKLARAVNYQAGSNKKESLFLGVKSDARHQSDRKQHVEHKCVLILSDKLDLWGNYVVPFTCYLMFCRMYLVTVLIKFMRRLQATKCHQKININYPP